MFHVKDVMNASCMCVHFIESNDVLAEMDNVAIAVRYVDVSNVRDEKQLFVNVSVALKFPDYFGRNWDALNDCLYDLEWLGKDGCVLVVCGAKEICVPVELKVILSCKVAVDKALLSMSLWTVLTIVHLLILVGLENEFYEFCSE